jgi:hypothetical protein
MVLPGRSEGGRHATASVTQDPSTGKKNELFGMEVRRERDTCEHLASKGASDEVISLSGTYSDLSGGLEGGEDGVNTQLAEILFRVLTESQAPGIVGSSQVMDTGDKNSNRVSLKFVKTAEDLPD